MAAAIELWLYYNSLLGYFSFPLFLPCNGDYIIIWVFLTREYPQPCRQVKQEPKLKAPDVCARGLCQGPRSSGEGFCAVVFSAAGGKHRKPIQVRPEAREGCCDRMAARVGDGLVGVRSQ